MNEHLETLKEWSSSNKPVAIARVIRTWGSSPRPVGSVMLINHEGKMAGSVSGGCVEGEVVKQALSTIEKKENRKMSFGISDDEAWSVGLSCGGNVDLLLETANLKQDPVWSGLMDAIENNRASMLVSSVEDGQNLKALIDENGKIIGDTIPMEVVEQVKKAYNERAHRTVEVDNISYFIQIFPRKSILLIIGAAHITVDLVTLGKMFGFETIVIDPRGYFTEKTTFKDPPDQLIDDYPSEVLDRFPLDAYTFSAVLSHDPKIDDDALAILLTSKVAYIGALGSRKTHEKRIKRLEEKGFSADLINRIQAPIGINIHAKSAREIAMSIMGQIIEVKNKYQ